MYFRCFPLNRHYLTLSNTGIETVIDTCFPVNDKGGRIFFFAATFGREAHLFLNCHPFELGFHIGSGIQVRCVAYHLLGEGLLKGQRVLSSENLR